MEKQKLFMYASKPMIPDIYAYFIDYYDPSSPSNSKYSVTNLGEVRGQDHTNNEQTQSVDGII